MLFKTLPPWLQLDLIQYFFNTETTLETLTVSQKKRMEEASPTELFDSWLIWTGIIGYTQPILTVHELLFGKRHVIETDVPDQDAFEAPVILKLYYKPMNEGSDGNCFITRAGFPSKEKATEFAQEWERCGNSVAWVKC
jgi:hypothetical protein